MKWRKYDIFNCFLRLQCNSNIEINNKLYGLSYNLLEFAYKTPI